VDGAATPIRDALVRVDEVTWDVPVTYRADMRVPVRLYASEELLEGILRGDALTQLVNVATLPGIVDFAYGMPDMHDGYGFPVGGVAATRLPDGIVSPGGVGFDINCGVRLLALPLTQAELGRQHEPLVHEMSRAIPSGTGRGGEWRLDDYEMDRVLNEGVPYLVRVRGDGFEEDIANCESGGCLAGADATAVSERARDRGRDQLGTMGSGNHFVELQVVDRIFDADTASAFGIAAGQLTVLIHTGSRGLGHQVCTDFVRLMDARREEYGLVLPDRQLSCAPVSSSEGTAYLAAMSAAANFAWSNRQMITEHVRRAVTRHFGNAGPASVRVVYDVAHNIAKRERYDGQDVCVHRKGATRAFGAGHEELPPHFQRTGQPVFIPGSMGTASYVLAGLPTSYARSWGSACHGAGRRLSRSAAKKQVDGPTLRKELEAQGIVVRGGSSTGLAEEAPAAYKDVDAVAAVVERAGLATRVARLRPIGVVKG
jgi:tRNA-splicing ligase RtcB